MHKENHYFWQENRKIKIISIFFFEGEGINRSLTFPTREARLKKIILIQCTGITFYVPVFVQILKPWNLCIDHHDCAGVICFCMKLIWILEVHWLLFQILHQYIKPCIIAASRILIDFYGEKSIDVIMDTTYHCKIFTCRVNIWYI